MRFYRVIITGIIAAGFIFSGGTGIALCQSAPCDCAQAKNLLTQAWDAQGKREFDKVVEYTQKIIDTCQSDADIQHAALKDYPTAEQCPLSEVAQSYFLQAEALMRQGDESDNKEKWEAAIQKFEYVIQHYKFSVAFDPSRGVYWRIAEISRVSVEKIKTRIEGEKKAEQGTEKKEVLKTLITLFDKGTEDFVSYEKYGEFTNVGTKDYKYIIKDQSGLSAAVGEGIYPNTSSIKKDPAYISAVKEKRLEGSHWNFVNTDDKEAAFLKWATCPEPAGVKLYYTGLQLERAGLITHALKAYYSIVVNFPGSYGWTYWHTPWYVGQAAISKINFLLRRHPQLGYTLEGADIKIVNGFDNDVSNDIVITTPGKFVKTSLIKKELSPAVELKVKKTVGKGPVHLVQYENGGWQLMVDDKPYVIKGITYSPTKVGQSPDEGTLKNWMFEDFNKNGKIDGPYDAFVDKNENNLQDPDEPNVGDFKLMQDMGVNTIRLYHFPNKPNKELLRDLYKTYGIRVIMGDFFGKYALGSKAPWNPGTDYSNEEHKKNMLDSVTEMVNEYKDEPYILFWLLGNENVYGVACNADKKPEVFFSFANEVAKKIKEIDPNHPVAICSGDVLYLDRFAANAPDVDIFGTNAYRGDYGFGFLWKQVKSLADKPVFITEYGCPAYAEGKTQEESETLQAEYHWGAWDDIELNMAGGPGEGNSVGGVIFEWLDEWWKAYEPRIHDRKGFFTGPFPDGYMHEEWLGIAGQGNGKLSPFLRHLRKAYFMYQGRWVGKPGHYPGVACSDCHTYYTVKNPAQESAAEQPKTEQQK